MSLKDSLTEYIILYWINLRKGLNNPSWTLGVFLIVLSFLILFPVNFYQVELPEFQLCLIHLTSITRLCLSSSS